MSIAEKLIKIAQNEPLVYEAGKVSQISGTLPAAVDASLFGGKLKTIAENTIKVFEKGRADANLQRATASGKVVRVDNVNPIEHELGVTVLSKNLCPTETLQTQSAYAWASKSLGKFDLPNGTYTFSCDYERLDEQNVQVAVSVKRKDGSQITEFYGVNGKMSKSFTVDDGGCQLYLYSNMSANVIETNALFKNIQLELGSTATNYTPYLTDLSGVSVTRYGKNLWNEQWEVGLYSVSTGNHVPNSSYICSKNDFPIEVLPNTQYHFTASQRLYVLFYDEKLVFLSYKGVLNDVLTTPDDCKYIKFYANVAYGTTYLNDICICVPSVDNTYEPYKEPQTAVSDANGKVKGLTSLSPTTTLIPDSDAVTVTAEYYISGEATS